MIGPNIEHHPLYKTWQGMKRRCYGVNATGFARYGGRGITVCSTWISDFRKFVRDMGFKPEGRTLDRIDTNGNYTPENCRWATWSEQALNKRPMGRIKYKGVKVRKGRYEATIWVNPCTIQIGTFDSPEEASNQYIKVKEYFTNDVIIKDIK